MSKNRGFSDTTANRYSLALYELAEEANVLIKVEENSNSFLKLIVTNNDFISLIKKMNTRHDEDYNFVFKIILLGDCAERFNRYNNCYKFVPLYFWSILSLVIS